MRPILLIVAIMLFMMGCAGSKPAREQAVNTIDDIRCKELFNLDSMKEKWVAEILKTPVNDLYNANINEYCPCYEIITCEKIDYCISYKCSNGITSIFD